MSDSRASFVLPNGETIVGVPVTVEESTERWSEYRLSDGTILRAKVAIAAAFRLDEFDPQGNPKYAIQHTAMILTATAGPGLQRKKS